MPCLISKASHPSFSAMPGEEPEFLNGKLLIAMPSMGDPRFHRSVILMCAHSRDGAMGLMVNKPAPDLRFADLLDQLRIDRSRRARETEIYFGGPVENGRGFVLHTRDYSVPESTMPVSDTFGMTATLDVLRDLADGSGPREALLALGYAGWGPGQLEGELQANGWLTCDADEAIIFEVSSGKRWAEALKRIGIDPRLLSADGGRA
ncbi:MAG: YqgE/AlgH family protein [Pseudomonadota bacterium]